MKQLPIVNPSFRYLEESFKGWLDVLGYSPSSVYNLPLHVRELLHYLESQGVNHIKATTPNHIKTYYDKLNARSNLRRGGGLSHAHLNKHLQAVRKFTDYLRQVGRLDLDITGIKSVPQEKQLIEYLTEDEINLLFQTTYHEESSGNLSEAKQKAIQSRDRAMLSVFYGCGLRRNEGVHLNVEDINFEARQLHVRKGKNYKERHVPISKKSLKHLTEYVYDYRSYLNISGNQSALFLNYRGMRMQGQGMLIRLKQLQYLTGDTKLQEKEIGLHSLRHSIATHLLQAGMALESISRFLGHSSLESTQIYTHLTAEASGEGGQLFDNLPTYDNTQLSEDE